MRKFLTPLAAISLIGSFLFVTPSPVAATSSAVGTWAVHSTDTNITRVDDSREATGKRQTYVTNTTDRVLTLTINLSADGEDLNDGDITLTLKNASFTGTYGVDVVTDGTTPADGDCTTDWNETGIGTLNGGVLVAAVDCTGSDGTDSATTLTFEVTLPAAGTSSVLTVTGAGTEDKVFFFSSEINDDIYLSEGTLGATPLDGNCADPDFSIDAGAQGSFQEALFAALAAVGGSDDEIIICERSSDLAYNPTGDIEGYLASDMGTNSGVVIHINENAESYVHIDGDDVDQLLLATGVSFDINGIDFNDGSALNGGAISVTDGDLWLTNTSFIGNGDAVAANGGAVYVSGGSLDIDSGYFEGNRANYGGAVYVTDGSIVSDDSYFDSNDADIAGGAIWHRNGALYMYLNAFYSNESLDDGGAVHYEPVSDNGEIYNSYFEGNHADNGDGGAVNVKGANDYSDMWIGNGSEFIDNSAEYGGAVCFYMADVLNINDVQMSGNHASLEGGAVWQSGYATYSDSTFTDNWADNDGGAIYTDGEQAWVEASTFTDNWSDNDGGAIYAAGDLEIYDHSTFTDNSSASDGGAVMAELELWVEDSTFRTNTAGEWGGAIEHYNDSEGDEGDLTVYRTQFIGNVAMWGGAIDTEAQRFYLTNSTFLTNKATKWGGAISRGGRTFRGDISRTNSFRGNRARVGATVALYGMPLSIGRRDAALWKIPGVTPYFVQGNK